MDDEALLQYAQKKSLLEQAIRGTSTSSLSTKLYEPRNVCEPSDGVALSELDGKYVTMRCSLSPFRPHVCTFLHQCSQPCILPHVYIFFHHLSQSCVRPHGYKSYPQLSHSCCSRVHISFHILTHSSIRPVVQVSFSLTNARPFILACFHHPQCCAACSLPCLRVKHICSSKQMKKLITSVRNFPG